jgi:hypothetical protein
MLISSSVFQLGRFGDPDRIALILVSSYYGPIFSCIAAPIVPDYPNTGFYGPGRSGCPILQYSLYVSHPNRRLILYSSGNNFVYLATTVLCENSPFSNQSILYFYHETNHFCLTVCRALSLLEEVLFYLLKTLEL